MIEYLSYAEIWWRWISKPRLFLNHLLTLVGDSKTIVLDGNNIPWKDMMRHIVESEIQNTYHIFTKYIDAKDVGLQSIDEYFLQHFGKPEDISGYRKNISPLPAYLMNKKILHEKLLWIYNVEESQLKLWHEFLRKYKTKSTAQGLFVFECGLLTNFNETSQIKRVEYGDNVGIYDILSFCMMLVANCDTGKIIKQYLAWLSASVFEKNVEMIPEFINLVISNGTEYRDTTQLLDEFLKIKKTEMDKNELKTAVWQAQIQVFFPLIEQLRARFIQRYYVNIENMIRRNDINWHGDAVYDPYEVELGFLVYLTGRKSEDNQRELYLSYNDYQVLHLLHDCRNALAHLEIINDDSVSKLIKLEMD